MDSKTKEQLESYFGEDEKIDFEKAEESDVITKSLETINEYREDFPDDLKKAVGVIAKQAGMYVPPAAESSNKNGKEDIEKAGAKFSKETLTKLRVVMEAIRALETVLPKESEKSDNSEDVLKAEVEKLNKSIEQLEEKGNKESKDELTKTLKDLTIRLAAVEKGTGIKKGIEGQDDDDDSSDKKWPSFSKKS